MSATVNNYDIVFSDDKETGVFRRQIVEAETEEEARYDLLLIFPSADISTVTLLSNNCLQSDPD